MKKYSVKIAGHPTSISLEEPFWDALKKIAADKETTLSALITEIDKNRAEPNLSSALRVYILSETRAKT